VLPGLDDGKLPNLGGNKPGFGLGGVGFRQGGFDYDPELKRQA